MAGPGETLAGVCPQVSVVVMTQAPVTADPTGSMQVEVE